MDNVKREMNILRKNEKEMLKIICIICFIIYVYSNELRNIFIGLINKLDMTMIRIMAMIRIRTSKSCGTILKDVTYIEL